MDAALLVALILLNGFFAMAEIALVTSRRHRLQQLADAGDRGAVAAIDLGANPTRFLSTLQIGITAIGILNGIIGEATFAYSLASWLQGFGLTPRASGIAATAIVVAAITYLTIVLGELVPKRLGQISPEAIARRIARPIHWLATAAKPFVRLLAGSTELVLRALRIREGSGQAVTEDEIHAMLAEGSQAGVIEEQEREIVRNVFRLDDRPVLSLMTPRSDIVHLDVEDPIADSLARIHDSRRSRLPVCRGGLSDILGVLTAKRMLSRYIEGKPPDIAADLVPAEYVPESLTGFELLEHFRASTGKFVFVVDEYGEVQGIVTLQDVFEAITGEFLSPTAEGAWAVQRDDGSWLLDGLIPVPLLKDRLALRTVPEEELGRYHTLSGMIQLLAGRVPQEGDRVQWEGWSFEVVDMDGKRIDKVLAAQMPQAAVEVSGSS